MAQYIISQPYPNQAEMATIVFHRAREAAGRSMVDVWDLAIGLIHLGKYLCMFPFPFVAVG